MRSKVTPVILGLVVLSFFARGQQFEPQAKFPGDSAIKTIRAV
jgi:hypothetical protein